MKQKTIFDKMRDCTQTKQEIYVTRALHDEYLQALGGMQFSSLLRFNNKIIIIKEELE